jgi:hypothetical protein
MATKHFSESKRFSLDIQADGSGGTIRDGDTIIFEITRNYPRFPFAFFKRDGREWLLCGRSYMQVLFLDLENRKEYEFEAPHGFIWAHTIPNTDGTLFMVEGCFWAAPYQIAFYKWSDINLPPIHILYESEKLMDKLSDDFSYDQVVWIDSTTIKLDLVVDTNAIQFIRKDNKEVVDTFVYNDGYDEKEYDKMAEKYSGNEYMLPHIITYQSTKSPLSLKISDKVVELEL